jgi:hypothetical protein
MEEDTNREAGRKIRDILMCCRSYEKGKGSIVVVGDCDIIALQK